MIKKYKQFNESIRNLLVGPSDDEILKNLKKLKPIDLYNKSKDINFFKGMINAFEKDKNITPNKLLIDCCEIGNLEGVKFAYEKGANLEFNDGSPLQIASRDGHLNVVKFLVESGVNIHTYNEWAFKMAFKCMKYDVSKYLLEKGANPNIEKEYDFLFFSGDNDPKWMKLLFDYGYKIKSGEKYILNRCVSNGYYGCVELLLKNGADVHYRNDESIKISKKNGDQKMIDLLQKYMN